MALTIAKVALSILTRTTSTAVKVAQLGPVLAIAANAGALVGVYKYVQHHVRREAENPTDHLIGVADAIGPYGAGILDEEFEDAANLTPDQRETLEMELELAALFDPFDAELSGGRAHRNLLRYWVARVNAEITIIGDSAADRAVIAHHVRKWMRQKNYRRHAIEAIADVVVGLAVSGTKARRYASLLPEVSRRKTFVEWFFRVGPSRATR